MDPSLDISKLSDADKADLQQQLANEQQKATIQQSKLCLNAYIDRSQVPTRMMTFASFLPIARRARSSSLFLPQKKKVKNHRIANHYPCFSQPSTPSTRSVSRSAQPPRASHPVLSTEARRHARQTAWTDGWIHSC